VLLPAHCRRSTRTTHTHPSFVQNLDDAVLDTIDEELGTADLLLIVGTSSLVYPAAGFAPQVAQR
jgi:NAD-dependent deacetylase sirtuin 5